MRYELPAEIRAAAFADRDMDSRRKAIESIGRTGQITEADVRTLRAEYGAETELTRDAADALFALEQADIAKCDAWRPFFVEAITEHVVWHARPTGVVNAAQAEWLIQKVDAAGSLNAFAVLVNVMAEAHRVPLWFLAAVRARAARGLPEVHVALAAAEAEARAA